MYDNYPTDRDFSEAEIMNELGAPIDEIDDFFWDWNDFSGED